MLRIETTPRFERRLIAFLKSHPDLRERTRALIDRLAENPFDPHNKTHKLSGKLKEFWGVEIAWSYRIVFLLTDESVTLINIGSHDEVY
ncbi:MAG: hypothetical protein A2W52_00440 [Candidatus Taylorbacteria bacterium RIFCSPHIGHO2_02_49_25]|uniref:Plasmid stabilization protein n=1 Tax=Candidatus Taylorbacteria bacterium RIFCSPHIGHO2_02_49_25 TaxID=1802305 RepID=A0A1G2MH74_9BACT|nr:MAG: hypothetical protein UY62_C0009G0021 [Parcubacteria group bacterium GW2011_GWF2_50_9]OHA20695.1 MAG: hypothetical protein A2759_03730 [Candidatus Taylorbacteria bacterium RIFCSPHIGHO2_01_FULL_49_60]OHA23064.1 MAG: hypothetical protein A2W52_00440 [Candidatus Taylorbacteria bacterium RIFCSPHIGHO2_02_49_25]OHA36400.1 MAG: hypothetical protein A2W65_02775 [Candidatus Taylorbacteria bacterium RIFCSPLOWO2_02_50_13]OHA48482.1 MAG: hypothetical protein A3G61_01640 [Candidatus Taylorbacteria ba